MKTLFYLACMAAMGVAFIAVRRALEENERAPAVSRTANAYKKQTVKGCAPDLTALNLGDPANAIPLLDGWGSYRMPVTTGNDSANLYFQQGINMYYGFHIIEALASFERAVQFDEHFAMGYWGKALAYGPNINDIGYAASPEALQAVRTARAKAANCTPVEQALIAAMEVRYSADSSQTREHLNQLYADAMREVHRRFPNSADAAALYADALMVQHPWDLYDRNYAPKPWTPEIVRVLEGLVEAFPDNPGASHYYIHAVEGSAQPAKALAVADRLGGMMPKVAHLVHMPSHIYIRTGYFDKGVQSNINAVNGYNEYRSKFPAAGGGAFLYLVHNLHLQAACAQMDASYSEALRSAIAARGSFDTAWMDDPGYFGIYAQYVYTTPLLTRVRFGRWADILKEPAVPPAKTYACAMQHFARGLAFARTHQLKAAKAALAHLKDSAQSTQLQQSPAAFNAGITAVNIAEKVLQGIIAEEEGDLTTAIQLLKTAVEMEDGMLYNEPKDWLLPVRHYLGNTLIKAGQYAGAEKVYLEDLLINPNNAWALTGLQNVYSHQPKPTAAAANAAALAKALARSDVKLTASVY